MKEPSSGRSGSGPESTPWLALALLTGGALLIRLVGAGGPLWIDEIATLLDFVRLPFWELVTSYESPNHHVFYSLLARGSVLLLGEGPLALRLPAIVMGAATIPALYYLVRIWLSRPVALVACLVLAVSFHHTYFSQNARGYTGLLLWSLLAAAFLARAMTGNRLRHWAGYAGATATATYTLLSGVFVAVGQALAAWVVFAAFAPTPSDRRTRTVRWVWGVGGAALLTIGLYLPLLGQVLAFYTSADPDVGWRPSLELIAVVLQDVVRADSLFLVVVGAVVGGGLAAWGAVDLARRAPFLLLALALPVLLESLTTVALGAGTYPRRFLLLLPLGIVVLVQGAGQAALALATRSGKPRLGRGLFAGLSLAFAAGASLGLADLYSLPMQDYPSAVRLIQEQRADEDLVAAAYITTTAMDYYAPWMDRARTADELEELLGRGKAVWLIGSFPGDMARRAPRLMRLVEEHFSEVARFPGMVGDGTVLVWRSKEPGDADALWDTALASQGGRLPECTERCMIIAEGPVEGR